MTLSNSKLAAYPEITISFETLTGKRIRFTLSENTTLQKLYHIAYQKREAQHQSATLKNYLRAINLFHQGIKLIPSSSPLRQTRIRGGSLIRVNFKKWMAGIGVDKATLSLIQPIRTLGFFSRGGNILAQPSANPWLDSEELSEEEDPTSRNIPPR